MKRFFNIAIRILTWALGSLLALLCLAALLLQTRPVKQQIARIAEQQASQLLHAELKIEELEGDFFTHIRLKQISLCLQNDTMVTIGQVELKYQLWSLLNKQVTITKLDISKPKIKLVQQNDSTWNFSNLLKEPDSPATSTPASQPFNWLIDLQQFELHSGFIETTATDSLLPRKIDGINVQLHAKYSANEQSLALDSFRLDCTAPNFSLEQFTFKIRQVDGIVTLSELLLQTKHNRLNAQAHYAANTQSALDLHTAPLTIDEFQFALPQLEIKLHPKVDWRTTIENDRLNTTISLTAETQKVTLTVQAFPVMAWIAKPDSIHLQYQLSSSFENVAIEAWSGITELQGLLNGTIQLKGEGTDPKTLTAQANAEIYNSSVAGYEIGQLSSQHDYRSGNLHTTLNVKTNFATLTAIAQIDHLLNEPAYQAALQASVFSLRPFLENDSLETSLHFDLLASGSGFDPQKLTSTVQLQIAPSMLVGIPIDTASTSISVNEGLITLDTLMLRNQSAELTAKGIYRPEEQSELNLHSHLHSFDAFRAYLADSLHLTTNTNIQAQLRGRPDSLLIKARATMQNSKYADFNIEKAELEAAGYYSSKQFEMETALNAMNLSGGDFAIDSITAKSTIHNDSLVLQTAVYNDFVNTILNARLNWKEQLKVDLDQWFLSVYKQNWQLRQPARLVIDSTSYQIHHFELLSENDEAITLAGIFNQQGALDMQLRVAGLKLAPALRPLELGTDIKGLAALNIALGGTAQQPILDSHLQIDSLAIANYNFKQAEATLGYKAGSLNVGSTLTLKDQGEFTAQGAAPVLIDLSAFKTLIPADSLIDAKAEIRDLPLALLQPFIHASQVGGLINGRFTVGGSLNAPQPSGSLQLDNGRLSFAQYGIDYQAIELKTSINNSTISIDTLGITTSDGTMTGGGKIVWDLGQLKESGLNLKFDQFNPINHKQINMQLSGDTRVWGAKDSVYFDGDLLIPQSEIYLPALMNLWGHAYTPEIPKAILVEELEKLSTHADSAAQSLPPIALADSLPNDSFSNITGRIKLKIPKNSWIKDPNLRVELSGDLEILKNPRYVEIFGAIQLVRGQYELFGRTFVVSEGSITFEGGETINPRLNLTASYSLKHQDRESQTLAVTVGGTTLEPTIQFTLDDQSITEGDALSYIVFGRGLNELSSSEQDDVSGMTGESMATSAAASLLASQLTKLLGNMINVDYIQLKARDNNDDASLEVGKYLTPDIFVSYAQQFRNSSNETLTGYEVKLEYEIFRFLFLQLNNSSTDSGFDVIFKIQSR
ncbi:translocation/assembly module TamB domain-containing protein [Mangrovibacterium marinum]|nr:translocation/assembly module TamB [Mangrovibacterium marinum]